MLYFYVFVFVCVRGWGGGPCIDWVIWVWCAVVQLESRVWGQRHNGRGIRGVRHGNIYGKGCLWASEHILCDFLQNLKDSEETGVWLALGWWVGWGVVVRRSGREPPSQSCPASLPAPVRGPAKCGEVPLCFNLSEKNSKTSENFERTRANPPTECRTHRRVKNQVRNTFSICSTPLKPSILTLSLPLCLHCKDISTSI